MSSLRWVLIGALCLGLGTACAKSKGPEAGTNTNWLKSCNATADCDGDGTCLCGVCTLGCTTEATCSRVGSRTRCTPMSEASCGANATGSACLPANSADASVADTSVADASAADASVIDADSPSTGDAGLTLVRVGAVVQVTERYRPCGLDDDCILVSTSCNRCCEQDAIRAHDRAAYETNFDLACTGYEGPMCRCQPLDLAPRCLDGLCGAVLRDPVASCFSPTRNFWLADRQDALGCACVQRGLQACVGGVGLRCAGDTDPPVWVVADGPCTANPADCPLERQRADADACLADYTKCFARSEGGFCGSGCRFPLACNGQECQYSPFTAECTGVGVWESVCGSVRYRTQGGGFGGPTWYWDEATGKLLATQYTSDFSDPKCEGVTVGGDFTVVESCEVVLDATTAICNWP